LAGDHEPLVEAIEAGDEDRAVWLLERHIVDGLPEVLHRLAEPDEAKAALARLLQPGADAGDPDGEPDVPAA
jgi:DNA-binding GntR family transcriptional regulator